MDVSKFMGKYRDATRDHLRRMNELLLDLEAEPDLPDHGDELMREIHTLKGESRMMGFADISDLAHAAEDLLKAQQQRGFRGLGGVTDLLFAAFDDVERLLREQLGEGPAGVDVEATCARLTAAAGVAPRGRPSRTAAEAAEDAQEAATPVPVDVALGPLPDVGAPADAREGLALGDLGLEGDDDEGEEWAPPEGDADPEASLREAFGVPEGLAQEIGEGGTVAAPGSRAVSLGGGPQKFLARYRDLADSRLHALQAALQALGRSRSDAAALASVASEAAALAEESRQLGFDGAARVAAACGELAARAPGGGLASDGLAALVAGVEALARLVAEALGGERAGADVDALVARLVPPEGATAPGEPPGAGAGLAGAAPSSEPGGGLAPAGEPARGPRAVAEETIRVSVAKLDRLSMLSTDIYLGHAASETRLRQLRQLIDDAKAQVRAVSRLGAAGGPPELEQERSALLAQARALRRGLQDLLRAERDELLRTGHSVVELRERVRELQMLPVSTLFDPHPRLVRDLSRELGKQARLVVEGAAVELDRRVLDEIRDPLVHLLRNAVDHGIESPAERQARGKPAQGTVTLAARPEGDHVVVQVADDGGGIDPAEMRRAAARRGVLAERDAAALTDEQAVNLIFAPGFSSKTEVSDISGRGVGLDVVRERVERLAGRLAVASEPGRGTRFEMRLPLTLAVARLLLVRAGGLLVALPATLVEEVVRLAEDDVRRVEGYEAMEWKDRAIPLVSLPGLLERDAEPARGPFRHVAVVRSEGHVVGFVVDALAGEREAIVKRLPELVGRLPHVAGATILTTGEVVTVLHVPQIIAATLGVEAARLRATVRVAEAAPRRRRRLLVVDDSIIVRDMMKTVLEGAGFEVALAVDGLDGLEKQLAAGHDAVITDVEMPRMDGFELVRQLRANAAHAAVPVVMVTTLDSAEARETGLRAGASAYLVKNLLDMSLLVDTLERLLA